MDECFMRACERRCDRIIRESLMANLTYSVFSQVQKLYSEKNEIIDLSPSFYSVVFDNCAQSLVVDIYKMFDSDSHTEGVRSLLQTMADNKNKLDIKKVIEANVFDDLTSISAKEKRYENIGVFIEESKRNIMENDKGAILRIKSLRDKYYAHFDKDVKDVRVFFSRNKISKKELHDLLLLNFNICNGLSKYFTDTTVVPMPLKHDDFQLTKIYIQMGINDDKL